MEHWICIDVNIVHGSVYIYTAVVFLVMIGIRVKKSILMSVENDLLSLVCHWVCFNIVFRCKHISMRVNLFYFNKHFRV